MCQNVFKNQEEKTRKEEFTKLFVAMVANNVQRHGQLPRVKKTNVRNR